MNVAYFRAAILKEYAQKWPKRLPSAIGQLGLTTGQDGFFVGALHSAFRVKEIEFLPFARVAQIRRSDCVIVNSKSSLMKQKKYGVLEKFGSVPKVLFLVSAKASHMPPDNVLDRFDLVYKREPYLDRDRYKIKPSNADKIRPTMLSCPFFRVKKKLLANGGSTSLFLSDAHKDVSRYEYDVGFIGMKAPVTIPIRIKGRVNPLPVWQARAIEEGLNITGVGGDARDTTSVLYVSRASATGRRLVDEAALLDELARFDVECVDLAGLSVKAQALLFRNAQVVVGIHGAGLTNLAFCREGPQVIELFPPRKTTACFANFTHEKSLTYHAVWGCERISDIGAGLEDFRLGSQGI